jgi:MFS family permease
MLPPNWRELGLVIATATCIGMTVALTVPLLTLSLERIGASPLTIGVNAAVGGVGIFLIGPFIARLSARIGPVGCFRLGLVVCAACLLLFLVRIEPWYWAGVRLVFGCAAALIFVVNEAAINGLAPSEGRGRVIGAYATLFTVGYAGGPLVLLAAGTEGPKPFLLATSLFLLALVPTVAMRRIEDRLRPQDDGDRLRLAAIARAAPLPLAAVLVYAFIEGAAFALMPVWALERGLTAEGAAALVGIWLSGNILLQLPLGWLADHLPRAWVIASCALL